MSSRPFSAKKQLVALLQKTHRHPALLLALLTDLLTPAEIEDLALRWRIVQALHAGLPQRTIAKNLGVSLAKITRGSRTLRHPRGGFSQLLNRKK